MTEHELKPSILGTLEERNAKLERVVELLRDALDSIADNHDGTEPFIRRVLAEVDSIL